MPIPELPWWPPSGDDRLSEDQVRELFAYLRHIVPPVMEDAKRRIRERVGDDPIQIWPTTIKQLEGRRLGYFSAVKIVQLSARDYDETVTVAIGLRPDGRLATLEGTPERRQQEWQVWKPGATISPRKDSAHSAHGGAGCWAARRSSRG